MKTLNSGGKVYFTPSVSLTQASKKGRTHDCDHCKKRFFMYYTYTPRPRRFNCPHCQEPLEIYRRIMLNGGKAVGIRKPIPSVNTNISPTITA